MLERNICLMPDSSPIWFKDNLVELPLIKPSNVKKHALLLIFQVAGWLAGWGGLLAGWVDNNKLYYNLLLAGWVQGNKKLFLEGLQTIRSYFPDPFSDNKKLFFGRVPEKTYFIVRSLQSRIFV